MNGAAERGRLDILQRLNETCSEGCTFAAMDGAVVNGHLDVVQWLEDNYDFELWPDDAVDVAIANGHYDVAEWLVCRDWTDIEWSDELIAVAQVEDSTMILLMLNCSVVAQLPFGLGLLTAAQSGQTEVVQLLRDRCQHSDIIQAANVAATRGHIDIVKLLLPAKPSHHNGETWKFSVRAQQTGKPGMGYMTSGIAYVAAKGDIETLRLLLQEPCSLIHLGRGLEEAAASGHTDVVKLLLRSLWRHDVSQALGSAVEKDHVRIVKLLVGLSSASGIKAVTAKLVDDGANSAEIASLLHKMELEKRKEEAKIRYEKETLEEIDCFFSVYDCLFGVYDNVVNILTSIFCTRLYEP